MKIKRGDVFYADLRPVVGSEQGGIRPVVILQNDTGNLFSTTTIIAPMTTQSKSLLPTHVSITFRGRSNTILMEQLRTISKSRLLHYMGRLSPKDMDMLDDPLKVALNIDNAQPCKYSKRKMPIKRGDIFYADLSPAIGSEQMGMQQVVVLQNDVGNQYSPTVIVAAITQQNKNRIPTHVSTKIDEKRNIILLEQVRAVSRSRLDSRTGQLDDDTLCRVNAALKLSLDIDGAMTNLQMKKAKKRFWRNSLHQIRTNKKQRIGG